MQNTKWKKVQGRSKWIKLFFFSCCSHCCKYRQKALNNKRSTFLKLSGQQYPKWPCPFVNTAQAPVMPEPSLCNNNHCWNIHSKVTNLPSSAELGWKNRQIARKTLHISTTEWHWQKERERERVCDGARDRGEGGGGVCLLPLSEWNRERIGGG